MATFQKMKENMILGQFLPGLVNDKILLNAFTEVDRENYLPNECKHLAYSDTHIRVSNDRYFISPFSLAKILYKADFSSKDVVLLIGSGYGYESVIVSKISSTVMALEENIDFFKKAEKNITSNQIENVININGIFLNGCKKYAPYDKIIILGSLEEPGDEIFSQLANNGKLLICENLKHDLDESKLYVYVKNKNKVFKEYVCDLNIPKLTVSFEKKSLFRLEK